MNLIRETPIKENFLINNKKPKKLADILKKLDNFIVKKITINGLQRIMVVT